MIAEAGEEALTSERIDVAFLWSPVTEENVVAVTMFQDRIGLLVATHHRLVVYTDVKVEDLTEERYMVTTTMSLAWQDASKLAPWLE